MIDQGPIALTRRRFLSLAAALGCCAGLLREMFYGAPARAQSAVRGLPLPDETVEAALKRVFAGRGFLAGEGRVTLDLPLIAEDGGNVPVTVEASLPLDGATRLAHIYLIADHNRLPVLAKFSFTADSGKAFIGTSIRLAASTDVRAVAEMSDGTLYAVTRHVRVVLSGCDLPPPG